MHPHQVLRGKLPNHLSQRMVVVDLAVPIGEKEQPVGSDDPPTQVFDGVEGCLISPLSVLDH